MMERVAENIVGEPDRVEQARQEIFSIFEEVAPANDAPAIVRAIGATSSSEAGTIGHELQPSYEVVKRSVERPEPAEYLRQIGKLIISQRSRNSQD